MITIIKKLFVVTTLSLAIALGGGTAMAQTKVGFVYIGPVGDHGWTYQHDQGRKAVEKAFGDKVKTTFLEKISEGPDAARRLSVAGCRCGDGDASGALVQR